jgi:type I site-specific restriction endonuclease
MTFPSSGDDVMSVASSTYADKHANEVARAPMVFPSSGDDVIAWTGSSTRADQLAAGASDPALSK